MINNNQSNLIFRSSNVMSFLLTPCLYFALVILYNLSTARPSLYRYYRKRIVSPYSIYLKFHTATGRYYHNRPHPVMQIYLDATYAPVMQTNLIYRPDGVRLRCRSNGNRSTQFLRSSRRDTGRAFT